MMPEILQEHMLSEVIPVPKITSPLLPKYLAARLHVKSASDEPFANSGLITIHERKGMILLNSLTKLGNTTT